MFGAFMIEIIYQINNFIEITQKKKKIKNTLDTDSR